MNFGECHLVDAIYRMLFGEDFIVEFPEFLMESIWRNLVEGL